MCECPQLMKFHDKFSILNVLSFFGYEIGFKLEKNAFFPPEFNIFLFFSVNSILFIQNDNKDLSLP